MQEKKTTTIIRAIPTTSDTGRRRDPDTGSWLFRRGLLFAASFLLPGRVRRSLLHVGGDDFRAAAGTEAVTQKRGLRQSLEERSCTLSRASCRRAPEGVVGLLRTHSFAKGPPTARTRGDQNARGQIWMVLSVGVGV